MFCPHCGAENRLAEGYCTRCGEYLPDLKSQGGGWPPRRRPRTPEQKMRVMAVFSAVNAALALSSSIALYATHLGRASDPDTHWAVFMAAAFCMVIAAHQTVSFIFNMQLQSRLKKARQSDARAREAEGAGARELGGADARRALGEPDAAPFEGVRSVTENTTELLEPVPRRGARGPER